jgi:CRISPR/Cas system-associated endoribonuclease Cas2
MYIVVSYDIEDDKRRGHIHRILKSRPMDAVQCLRM